VNARPQLNNLETAADPASYRDFRPANPAAECGHQPLRTPQNLCLRFTVWELALKGVAKWETAICTKPTRTCKGVFAEDWQTKDGPGDFDYIGRKLSGKPPK
jgi:hypothetical protein